MALGGTVDVTCTIMASYQPRDSFWKFFVLFVCGQAICNGVSYMVPIQLGWRAFPHNPGLVSGFIIGGFGLGGLIFSYVSSVLVNPNNL